MTIQKLIMTLTVLGILAINDVMASGIISHDTDANQIFDLSFYQNQLKSKNNLLISFDEENELLRQLSEFELGRFLLKNKGLNGYWTSYVILQGPQKENLHPLEQWILHKAPVVKATQERFQIFKLQLQKNLRNGIKIMSIPCGLMDDLLSLDFNGFDNVHLVGADLDEDTLLGAKKNATAKYNLTNVDFIKIDAWKLGAVEEYDIITSNGLNIYQPNDEKVIDLYKKFYQALKPGGILITSFLTPPPSMSTESTWKNFDPSDALKQKVLFSDIIQVNWQTFRTEAQTRLQLAKAGFKTIEFINDSCSIFPTVTAIK